MSNRRHGGFRSGRNLGGLLAAVVIFVIPRVARGQTNDAISREVSVFNFGGSARLEAVSREVSAFNFGSATANAEAISREVSVFNFGQGTSQTEAISRELSVFNFGQGAGRVEAVSREVSIFSFGALSAGAEAVSREVSVFNRGITTLDAISRELSVFNFGQGTATLEGISRELSVFNYGVNHMELTIGSTVLQSGAAGGVPITLYSLAPITNLQFTLNVPQNVLTNWTVQPAQAATGNLVLSNAGQLSLTFSPSNTSSFVNTQQLGQVNFFAISNQTSAFLPLRIAGASGPRPDGTDTPIKAFHNGEVVVLHILSLVRASVISNGLENITLYGLPGTNYTIESTTNLGNPTWSPVASVTLADFVYSTGPLPNTNAIIFYRARQ
jgi:hypothetical protein